MGSSQAGFTLIEVMIAIAMVAIGLSTYVVSIALASVTSEVNRQSALAIRAGQQQMEQLKGADFATVFASFNWVPADDPGVPGSAPGASFDVDGLDPIDGDPDGRVGEISFPVTAGALGVLREDLALSALGMPLDLDGDGVVDASDHSGDYRLLPVRVRLQWRGRAGTSRLEFKTILMGM